MIYYILQQTQMKEETSDFPSSHSLPVDPGKDKTNNDNSNNNNSFYKSISKEVIILN